MIGRNKYNSHTVGNAIVSTLSQKTVLHRESLSLEKKMKGCESICAFAPYDFFLAYTQKSNTSSRKERRINSI
jgi:hypothetical protein